jgi:hypothetical protein
LESEPRISNNWVVLYKNRRLQLDPQSQSAPAQDQLVVSEKRHGNLKTEYRGRPLRWQEIPAPHKSLEATRQLAGKPGRKAKPPHTQQKWVQLSNQPKQEAARQRAHRRALKLKRQGRVRDRPSPSRRPNRSALPTPQGEEEGRADDEEKNKDQKRTSLKSLTQSIFVLTLFVS